MIYKKITRAVRSGVVNALKLPKPYEFIPAHSVQEQSIRFAAGPASFEVAADYRTPLYDMIAEVVDYDCYQLKDITLAHKGFNVIFDVGANIGVTALVLSKFPASTVYAFEPLPANCEWIRKNVDRNNVRNVIVIQKALTALDGTMSFQVNEEQSVAGRIVEPGGASDSPGVVKVRTCSLVSAMRELNVDHIDLMKSDCEGGEYEIVSQIDKSLAERIRFLTFEVHDVSKERNIGMLSAMLEKLGYRVKQIPEMYGRSYLHHLLAWRV